MKTKLSLMLIRIILKNTFPFWTFDKKIRYLNDLEAQLKSTVNQIIITIEKLIGCKQAKKITLLYNDYCVKDLAIEQVQIDVINETSVLV